MNIFFKWEKEGRIYTWVIINIEAKEDQTVGIGLIESDVTYLINFEGRPHL